MQLMDKFETAGMSEMQFLRACYDEHYTYQDYVSNCELVDRDVMSQRLFNMHMADFAAGIK